MKRKFDDVLNECIDRLSRGDTIEGCLGDYPGEAEELKSLLQIAQATRDLASEIGPRSEFQAQVLYNLFRRASESGRRRPAWLTLPSLAKPVVLGAAVLLLVLGGAAGTTAAAGDSVPGEALYPVKTWKERILLMIPRSDISEVRFEASLAQTRNTEMMVLMERGDVENVQMVADRLEKHLERAARVAVDQPGAKDASQIMLLREHIKRNWERHEQNVARVLPYLPPPTRLRLQQFVERSDKTFEAAVATLGETSGTVVAVDSEGRSLLFRSEFGLPVRLQVMGWTKIMSGDQEVAYNVLRLEGVRIWVDFNPQTRQVREIRLLK